MTSTQPKPELAGVKVRKRKKDIKAKYEPADFRDHLIEDLEACEPGSLEAISKCLDALGNKLDYKRYGEILFDVLFTGGILDVGGGIVEDGASLSPFSIFSCEDEPDTMKGYVEVINHLIRRYRYLQRSFEDDIKKLLRFLNRFTAEENAKLAAALSIFMSQQVAPMSLLTVLFMDHLAKEGLSLQFVTHFFRAYLEENSIEHLSANLKKNGLEDKMLDFFPPSKRSSEAFSDHFSSEGLDKLVKYHGKKVAVKAKDELREAISEMISNESSVSEMSAYLKQQMAKPDTLSETDMISIVFDSIMNAVEFSRRGEQCEEQALRQIKEYGKLLGTVCLTPRSEIALFNRIQIYCYEDNRLTKSFVKMITLLYKLDVITENAVVYWNQKGAASRGRAMFIKQMEPLVKFLETAEEESDEEDK